MNTKKNAPSQETWLEATPIAAASQDYYAEHEQYLNDYNHCCLCGDELVFTHVTNFLSQSVREEAHCPSCNVRTKEHSHKLQ